MKVYSLIDRTAVFIHTHTYRSPHLLFDSKHKVNTFAEKNVQIGGPKVEISSKIKILGNI